MGLLLLFVAVVLGFAAAVAWTAGTAARRRGWPMLRAISYGAAAFVCQFAGASALIVALPEFSPFAPIVGLAVGAAYMAYVV